MDVVSWLTGLYLSYIDEAISLHHFPILVESLEVLYCEKEGSYRDPRGLGDFTELPI